MIPAATLAAMQAAANKTLDQTATIQRNNTSSFNLGQPVENWQNIATNVAMRLAQPSQALMQQYDALAGAQQSWVVSFKATQDIKERDRIVVASMGITLTVQVTLNQKSRIVLNRVFATQIG